VNGEEGFVGGLEGLLFGMLLFVAGTLLLTATWSVLDAKLTADQAARDAARAYVEGSDRSAAVAAARAAATADLDGARSARSPRPAITVSGGWVRCARVVVTVEVHTPLVAVPFVGHLGGVGVRSSATEVLDPFRAGLPGAGACP
jgi:hypothetical protein